MKALLCRAYGPEENLAVEEVDAGAVGPGEARIAIAAAGVNFPDLLMVRGQYQVKPELPFVPGAEGAGVVTELGEGVDGLAVGDRVLFTASTGAFAEEIVIPAAAAVRFPDSMSFQEAAGLTIVYATTYHALKQRAALSPGETLLVLGAAGGVGLAAVELGKAMGARVIAAASTPDKLAAARERGADEAMDYAAEDLTARAKALTGGKGVDVIYDPVGGAFTEAAFRAIAPLGRHLVIGFAAGEIPKLPLNLPLLKRASVVGVFWGAWARSDPAGQARNMAEIFALYENGAIKPRVAASYPLEGFLGAFELLSTRRAIGKVVLEP